MNTFLTWAKKVLIGIGIAFLAITLYKACRPEIKEPATHKEAEKSSPLRDTLELYKYRLDTLFRPFRVEVPVEVITYKDKYIPGPERYMSRRDSLDYEYIIDSLTGKIVSMGKIRDFINSSKLNLIAGNFKKNQITLDLMDIEGNVKTKVYSVDYNINQYYYDGEGVRSERLKHTLIPTTKLESPKALFTTGYVSAHYNPFNKTTRAEVEYYLFYGRVGILNRVSIDVSSNPQPAYRIGLTYRFK